MADYDQAIASAMAAQQPQETEEATPNNAVAAETPEEQSIQTDEASPAPQEDKPEASNKPRTARANSRTSSRVSA